MKNILITGGSGFIGRALTSYLYEQGFSIALLSRKNRESHTVRTFIWDIETAFMEREAIEWAHIIIHLAGENISKGRWTNKRKKILLESRINSTALLVKSISEIPNSISCVIAASAIGFYGDCGNKKMQEDDNAGEGFLAECVKEWEKSTDALQNLQCRFVRLRIGIVLSKNGAALKELSKTIPFGFAPVLGNGKQLYSWIHIDDLCRMFLFAINMEQIQGTYNAVSPNAVSQKQLIQSFVQETNAHTLLIYVPSFLLNLFLGEMSTAVLISQNINADKILSAGFSFNYNFINDAMRSFKK